MSATEALDAYLERQQSSKKASSSARAVGKPQEQVRAAAHPPVRSSKAPESGSRLRNMAKRPLLKAGVSRADDRAREGAIKAVWPPSPLDEKDERPLLAKAHPATARTAQGKPSGDQAGALTKLKKLSSTRLRNASGASPQGQAGSEATQPDHFAAALEKLRRDRQAENQTSKRQGQPGAGQHASAHAAGEGSQESPGQQRRARWDPLADTEDRLALQRLTQKAAALSAHPSPTKGHNSDGKQHAEGGVSLYSQPRLAIPAAVARPDGLNSRPMDSAQTQHAKESAQILNEVLLELHAAEERSKMQQDSSTGISGLTQAAHQEASALGAVTAWYRDVQRKHAAAGLGDNPIIASILPGSSRKLRQHDAPPGGQLQAELSDGSESGPLLQALMASLPKVPEMPKKGPAKLPVMQGGSASPQQQSQGHTYAAAPAANFATKFSGLAEDMPRLHRDAFLQGDSQVAEGNPDLSPPMQHAFVELPAMLAQSPAAVPVPIVAAVAVPEAPQHIPSSVARDLALLQQRWQDFREPSASKPVPNVDSSAPSREALPHRVTAGAHPHQHSMGHQQEGIPIPPRSTAALSGVPAHSYMDISPSARRGDDRAEPGQQRRPMPEEDRAAPVPSPLSAFSPAIGTPMEYIAYSALPAADIVPGPIQERASGSGFSYQAARSPGQHIFNKPCSDMPQAPLSHSSIRQLWGHPERKEGGQKPWAAELGTMGPAWAAHDRVASAMLDSQPRGSPAHLSDVQIGFRSEVAECLTEASVRLLNPHFDRYSLPASPLQHSRSSMSIASGASQGSSRNPAIAPPGTADSMDCASPASHKIGFLNALLADAVSQDEDEMHDMHARPGGLGLQLREDHVGASERLLLEGCSETAGLEPDVAVSRHGSSRASLVAHYMQRGRAAAHRAHKAQS